MEGGGGAQFEPLERKTIVTEVARRPLDYLLSDRWMPGKYAVCGRAAEEHHPGLGKE